MVIGILSLIFGVCACSFARKFCFVMNGIFFVVSIFFNNFLYFFFVLCCSVFIVGDVWWFYVVTRSTFNRNRRYSFVSRVVVGVFVVGVVGIFLCGFLSSVFIVLCFILSRCLSSNCINWYVGKFKFCVTLNIFFFSRYCCVCVLIVCICCLCVVWIFCDDFCDVMFMSVLSVSLGCVVWSVLMFGWVLYGVVVILCWIVLYVFSCIDGVVFLVLDVCGVFGVVWSGVVWYWLMCWMNDLLNDLLICCDVVWDCEWVWLCCCCCWCVFCVVCLWCGVCCVCVEGVWCWVFWFVCFVGIWKEEIVWLCVVWILEYVGELCVGDCDGDGEWIGVFVGVGDFVLCVGGWSRGVYLRVCYGRFGEVMVWGICVVFGGCVVVFYDVFCGEEDFGCVSVWMWRCCVMMMMCAFYSARRDVRRLTFDVWFWLDVCDVWCCGVVMVCWSFCFVVILFVLVFIVCVNLCLFCCVCLWCWFAV